MEWRAAESSTGSSTHGSHPASSCQIQRWSAASPAGSTWVSSPPGDWPGRCSARAGQLVQDSRDSGPYLMGRQGGTQGRKLNFTWQLTTLKGRCITHNLGPHTIPATSGTGAPAGIPMPRAACPKCGCVPCSSAHEGGGWKGDPELSTQAQASCGASDAVLYCAGTQHCLCFGSQV